MPDPGAREQRNPLGMQGIEFIEYLSADPEGLGQVLVQLGFRRIARHRSRDVFLYRQGTMNLIVNADRTALQDPGQPDGEGGDRIHALAVRVADARQAYRYCVQLGARPVPSRAEAMELNIPGFEGIGGSVIYLADQRRNIPIYDVDFEYLDETREVAPIVPGLHFFGLAQHIHPDSTADWVDFYARMLGFHRLAPGTRFGILPSGTILQSPCRQFYLQLVEPVGNALFDVEWYEQFSRLALGTPDVALTVRALRERGIQFEDNEFSHPDPSGAVMAGLTYDISFELVRNPQPR